MPWTHTYPFGFDPVVALFRELRKILLINGDQNQYRFENSFLKSESSHLESCQVITHALLLLFSPIGVSISSLFSSLKNDTIWNLKCCTSCSALPLTARYIDWVFEKAILGFLGSHFHENLIRCSCKPIRCMLGVVLKGTMQQKIICVICKEQR